MIRPIEDLKEAKVSGNLKTSDEVLAIGKLSSSIKLLEDSGVCVFIGFTTFRIFNTDVLPTEYDWEIFTHYVTEKTKAVLIFGNCQVKARLETINVGLTWQEARDLLLDRLESTRSSNNIYVRGNDYGIKEDSLYKMRDNINTPLSTEEDGFDEIPF